MISYHVMWSTYNGLKYCNSGLSQRAFYYFYYPYILYSRVCWLHRFSFVSTSSRSPVQTVYVSRPAIDNSGRSLGGGLLSTSTNSQVVSFTMMILKWAFTASVYLLRWVPCPPLRSHVRATLIWSIACHSSHWLSPKTWSLNGDVWSGHCCDNCKKLSGALSPRPWLFWFQIWP